MKLTIKNPLHLKRAFHIKIYKGEKLLLKHIKFIRPATGIKIKDLKLVLNKKVKKNLNIDDFLEWKHLEK